jgi:hypothetical protein
MERHSRRSGWVTQVPCRGCSAIVLSDRSRMRRVAYEVGTCCDARGSAVDLPRSDAERGRWMPAPPIRSHQLDARRPRLDTRRPRTAGEPGSVSVRQQGSDVVSDEAASLPSPLDRRRPDYGNVLFVDCRSCGTLNLLDPTLMEDRRGGVFLRCIKCGKRFVVRRTDVERPVPNAELVLLPTDPSRKPPGWWRRQRR